MESVEISLVNMPVGFRFRPTDEELVNQYLKLKKLGNKTVEQIIPEVDVHQLPPWDLPGKINELSRIKSDGDEWFFFCRLQNKYPQSKRARRTNDYGSWKPTGKTHKIRTQDKKIILGLKKILVFKIRQSPKNAHTKWVLHEYYLNADVTDNVLNDQSDFVLYRLKKNPDKTGKKNSKTQKTNTGISIMPQEGSRSSPNTLDEVNNTSISIMPQEGSRSSCNTPDEVNNTSCSNALATAKSIVSEEIPKESLKENLQQPPTPILSPECNSSQCDFSATPLPPTATGEQFTHDSVYQDLESYFAETEEVQELLDMLNS
ncbi:NAC domain-containing protein 14-like [Syzygium oleosum]|uniref:NAC domain-containing protein 14-like n=1 Tax=Syzygium oleosum TaxID=219896 RepID=UPI0011D25816|nr:NAC domain-containing protein 14-like [Syzygium oleosum]XP_056161485.1 NAC domain-containing protein 14-like [Syzygium oleosum]